MTHITEREIITADTAQLYEWLDDTEYMQGQLAVSEQELADQLLRIAVRKEFTRRAVRNRRLLVIASVVEFEVH